MRLFAQLDSLRNRWNVLQHPFYERWSAGLLSRGDLAIYSGQYRHVVVALAELAAGAARAAEGEDDVAHELLRQHAAEEADHIALWDRFIQSVGGDVNARPAPETRRCAETLAGDEEAPLVDSLVATYTIEVSQPMISELKRTGLVDHYGFPKGDATAYFDVHSVRDVEHARQQRVLIEPRFRQANLSQLLSRAEAVLEETWRLLDGVDRLSKPA